MLEDPSEIDDVARELSRTPLKQQSEGSLKLYLDQLSLAEEALRLIKDKQGDPDRRTEAKMRRSVDIRGEVVAEIERRVAARNEAVGSKELDAVPFTDDRARDRYSANGGNWASERSGRPGPDAPTYSKYALIWAALIAFTVGALIRRR